MFDHEPHGYYLNFLPENGVAIMDSFTYKTCHVRVVHNADSRHVASYVLSQRLGKPAHYHVVGFRIVHALTQSMFHNRKLVILYAPINHITI